MEDPVVPLERNLYGHPLAGLLRERQFERVLLEYGWEKVCKLGRWDVTHTAGSPSTKSMVRYPGTIHWDAEMGGCGMPMDYLR